MSTCTTTLTISIKLIESKDIRWRTSYAKRIGLEQHSVRIRSSEHLPHEVRLQLPDILWPHFITHVVLVLEQHRCLLHSCAAREATENLLQDHDLIVFF